MKTYQIDANGNALLLVRVEGDKIEILNGMNGWGNNIKDHITVEEVEFADGTPFEIKEE